MINILEIKKWIQENDYSASPDDTESTLIRQIAIRASKNTKEALVTIVSASNNYKKFIPMAEHIISHFDIVKGVTLNIQPKRTNLIFGNKTICLAGSAYIKERFLGLELFIASTNFFQINTELAEITVSLIRDWLMTYDNYDVIVDAYSGIGTISLPLACIKKKIIGIENNKLSVRMASLNADVNNIKNTTFIYGDVDEILNNVLSGRTALIIDPPRKGLSEKTIDSILNNTPPIIAYLSCNPSTLARDLNRLVSTNNDYKVISIQPFDYFPQTTHVEVLALLEKTKFT